MSRSKERGFQPLAPHSAAATTVMDGGVAIGAVATLASARDEHEPE